MNEGVCIDIHEYLKILTEKRSERMERISWWDSDVLEKSKVMVVGAGALGNEILKNLALAGVGKMLIFDIDKVEGSNLSRCVLFSDEDRGKDKAEVAEKSIRKLNSNIKVRGVNANIVWGVGQGIFRRMDIVVGSVDNRIARCFINRYSSMFSVPYIDSAMQELEGTIQIFHTPRTGCYECTLSKDDYKLLAIRYPCFGLQSDDIVEWKVPSIITTATIIGGIVSQEVLKLLHIQKGKELPDTVKTMVGKEFRYKGDILNVSVWELPTKEECYNPFCRHPVPNSDIIELKDFSRDRSVKELKEVVISELGDYYSILLGVQWALVGTCPKCRVKRKFYIPENSILQSEAKCPKCNIMLDIKTINSLDDVNEDLTLRELNIPPLYIFKVTTKNGVKYVEITGDIKNEDFLAAFFT